MRRQLIYPNNLGHLTSDTWVMFVFAADYRVVQRWQKIIASFDLQWTRAARRHRVSRWAKEIMAHIWVKIEKITRIRVEVSTVKWPELMRIRTSKSRSWVTGRQIFAIFEPFSKTNLTIVLLVRFGTSNDFDFFRKKKENLVATVNPRLSQCSLLGPQVRYEISRARTNSESANSWGREGIGAFCRLRPTTLVLKYKNSDVVK